MTSLALKIVLGLLVFGALGLAFKGWLDKRDKNQENAAIAEQAPKDAIAITGIVSDASTVRDETAWEESEVAEARVVYHRVYEEAKRNDPSIDAWSRTPIPQRMRDIAADRARERQRSGGPTGGGRGDDPAEDRPR